MNRRAVCVAGKIRHTNGSMRKVGYCPFAGATPRYAKKLRNRQMRQKVKLNSWQDYDEDNFPYHQLGLARRIPKCARFESTRSGTTEYKEILDYEKKRNPHMSDEDIVNKVQRRFISK